MSWCGHLQTMMLNYLAPIIPVRWCRVPQALALLSLCAMGLSAQTLETLGATYRKTPNARTRAAVLRFANAHPADKNGALALLLLGATEIDQRQYGDALQHLQAAGTRLPNLADYAGYWSAVAESELRQFPETEQTLAPVWLATPASPLTANSVVLGVNSYIEAGQAQKALIMVTRHLHDLTEPQAELLFARSYDADANTAAPAVHYQQIYVQVPLSKEASEPAGALERFPGTQPHPLLTRGFKLIEPGAYARGRTAPTSLLVQLRGAA